MKKFILMAMLLCPFIAVAKGKITKKNYRIYSVKLAREVTLDDIADDMENFDALFFGEEHNDSVTHFLEKSMLEILYRHYGHSITLSMEMFERDVQPVMNEYLGGFIREKNFMKDARVWSNYRDYKPMVEFAKDKGLDVICANAASRYTSLAGRKGQEALEALPEESKAYFAPLPYDTATGDYHIKLSEIPKHGPDAKDSAKAKVADTAKAQPMMNMGDFNLIVAQSLWDATMAYSISKYIKLHKGKKVFQVNGKFHSDEGFGVAGQLKKYSPKTKRLIISSVSDENFPKIKWSEYKKMGDYIIITDPKVPRTYKDQ